MGPALRCGRRRGRRERQASTRRAHTGGDGDRSAGRDGAGHAGSSPRRSQRASPPAVEPTGFISLTRGLGMREGSATGSASGCARARVRAEDGAVDVQACTPATPPDERRSGRALTYRYPESGPRDAQGAGAGVPGNHPRRGRAGVAHVLSRARGVRVEPLIVARRRRGPRAERKVAALPLDHNPYLPEYREPSPASGANLPAPGAYDVVFDSGCGRRRGVLVPVLAGRLGAASCAPAREERPRDGTLVLAVTDAGSGVDPSTLHASIDGGERPVRLVRGLLRLPIGGLRRAVTRSGSGVRLPGDEERREHLRDPPEHVAVQRDVHGSRPLAPLLVVDRRKLREVALHAGGEVVRLRPLRPQQAQVRLAPLTSRLRRPSTPNRCSSRGHSAATRIATAHASKATKTQLTGQSLPTAARGHPRRVLERGLRFRYVWWIEAS